MKYWDKFRCDLSDDCIRFNVGGDRHQLEIILNYNHCFMTGRFDAGLTKEQAIEALKEAIEWIEND